MAHEAIAEFAESLMFSPNFDVICDLLLTNARQGEIYLFYTIVKQTTADKALSFQSKSFNIARKPALPTLANTKKAI